MSQDVLKKELNEIKEMALNYQDPIRGKILFLISYIETYIQKVREKDEKSS